MTSLAIHTSRAEDKTGGSDGCVVPSGSGTSGGSRGGGGPVGAEVDPLL